MEDMRTLLRETIKRSLQAMRPEDRLSAAWPVTCGKAMAGRGEVTGYQDGVVEVQVADAAWLRQMRSVERQLAGQLTQIAGVKVSEIHFTVKRKIAARP